MPQHTQQSGAEASLSSVKAAEAYLAARPDKEFILEIRAAWHGMRDYHAPAPSPTRTVRALEKHARKLRALVAPGTPLGRSLKALLWSIENRDEGNVEFRRRLATEPLDQRFALVLANHAFTLTRESGIETRREYRVSGRLAAVLAKVEGVRKPAARRRKRNDNDAAHDEVRAWEATMARATKQIAKWRSDDC